MAEIKVSQLPEATQINDDDLIMIVQSGTNKKITKENCQFASGDEVAVSTTEPTEDEKLWIKSDETTDQARYKDGNTWKELSIKALDSMVIGSIIQFVGTTIPNGWLECDGSTITQSAYPELYDLIGGTLPDFRGRVLVGQDTNDTDFDTLLETGGEKKHQLIVDEIPPHSHNNVWKTGSYTTQRSALDWTGGQNAWQYQPTTETGGGQAHNNLQPYAVVKHIIKAKNTKPTMASLVNDYSTSTQDGYACDYLNKHYGGVVLYENSTGTTGDITLSDSLDNYTSFELIATDNDDSSISFNSMKFDTSKTKYRLMGSSVSGTSFNVFIKEYTKGTNKLTASTGKLYIGSSGSVANYEVFKVYKVIGYK